MNIEHRVPSPVASDASPRPAAWAALATLLLMLSALPIAAVGASRLPGPADRYVPAHIAHNLALITADATAQLAIGTILVILAVTLGAYLAPAGLIGRLALIAGIIGGMGFIAAGAIIQEAVYNSVFVDGAKASDTATAAGLRDLTAVNLAAGQVAGGMRSAGSYSFGLAWFALAVVGLRAGRLPRLLALTGMIAGLGFALTNWIGPIAGPIAFFGTLFWLGGLAFVLFRRGRPSDA